ncbi:hypothetical protein BGZ98_007766 [Dissophora globulifera]|nr:hypothetical protein BGZ98_007766 [Dissophora globulifera]
MAVNMTDGCGSSAEFEPYSHFAHQSPQLDAPSLYSSAFSDDLPSLGLTGDTSEPRKRIRGERIVWTPEEDEFLRRAVHIYGDKTEKWAKIAACVPGRTNKNCRKRWFHSLDPSLRKGGWTEEEDHLLRTGVQKFRGQWSKIAERIQGRTDDQCAKRWRESLDPEIDRAAWTPEDDMLLLRKFEEFGTQWQRIALSFPGRPGLHCRNRWRKIQRSLSHSERASKRRRNQFISLDGHLASSSSKASEPVNRHHEESAKATAMSPEDALMQESFLDDKFDLLEGNDDLTDDRNDSNPDEERPYGCAVPDCKFESSSPSLLFYHFKASHHGTTVLKPFRCTMPGCEGRKRYKNINGLQYHVAHAKSTAGHSGHGTAQQDGQQESTSPSGTSAEDSPKPTSNGDYHIPYPTPGSIGDSTSFPPIALPTPAEIQSRFQSALSQPIITRHAFNIPHTPETREGSLIPSPLSLDTPLPQSYSPSLQCPELGCGHIFQALPRLTAHMASNHGHQSMAMTMESNESTIGSEAIAIPESDFGDIDIDLNFLSQDDTSPMDTNMLLMEDLQPQFSRMERNRETFFLNSMSSQVLTASTMGSTQDMDILSMKELLFANHIVSSLNNISLLNNRIHFGTHINVRADYTPTLPSTPVTSANHIYQIEQNPEPVKEGATQSSRNRYGCFTLADSRGHTGISKLISTNSPQRAENGESKIKE